MKVFHSCSSNGRLAVLLLACDLLLATVAAAQDTGGSGMVGANTLLNNRDSRTGTFPNPNRMPYPTSTYVDSRDDPYTRNLPNPTNPKKRGFTDYWGNPLIVDTKIHDVKFCNGTKWSSEPDGIVNWIPEPVLKSMNGVIYYEYFALLSGQGFYGYNDPTFTLYIPNVYGPIDNKGIDMSNNPASPRNEITYLPVYLAYPAQNWNGKLIHYIHPMYGDIFLFAFWFPHQTYLDVQYLLKKGYAVCMHLNTNGLLDSELNINAHDKHYWDEFAKWLTSPPYDANWNRIYTWKGIARSAVIDGNGNELAVPGFPFLQFFYPYPPYPTTNLHPDAALARNVVHFVKNLLWYKLEKITTATYLFGHSRSSETVMGVNCGRINEFVPYRINSLTPRTGGNFVLPYNPASGLVYNGFFDRSPTIVENCADPEFPVTAPLIATIGNIDSSDYQMWMLWAIHGIKKTRPDYDLNQWFRFYAVEMGNHMPRSSHFATLYNGSNWFYQFGDEQPNQAGKGSRLSFYIGEVADALTRLGYPPGTPPSDPYVAYLVWGALDNAWCAPMESGMAHECLDNLVAWAEQGIAPPKSRVWSERVLAEPYKIWLADLPLYYWSDYQPAWGSWWAYEWPESFVSDKAYSSKWYPNLLAPAYLYWESVGSKAVFYPTEYYLEKWVNVDPARPTYDPVTRRAWSVVDTAPNPQAINPYYGAQKGAPYLLDPYWEYKWNRTLRPVMSDCAILPNGPDDCLAPPQTFARDALMALRDGMLFEYSTAPLRMPNIAVRLGLYIDGGHVWNGYWPYIDPFTADELLNGYTDPYGNSYAGYANHGDYVNRVKDAVDSLISQGLYDPKIGHATVIDEAAHSPYPLPQRKYSDEQKACQGFWSDITNKCYATIEEREKAEERLAAFFGREFGKENGWEKTR